MKATCEKRVICEKSGVYVENTKWGPYEKAVTFRVTEQKWSNYPGKVSEFTQYAVDTFWNGRLVEGHVTPTLPEFAR